MSCDWPLVSLGDVATIFDGPHATPKKTSDGPIFLGISALERGRLNLSGVAHLSETDFAKWTRRVTPEPGDVVFSYETRLGEAAMIPPGLTCCLGRRMGLLRADPAKVDSQFLLYAYLGPEFQQVIAERTIHGSTVNRIALTEMGSFPLRLPSIPEQRRVAAVLGALDAAANAAETTAHHARQMASLLFERTFGCHWPSAVHAGHEACGGVWGCVGDLAGFVYGKALTASTRRPGDVRVVGSSGVVGVHDEVLFDGPAIVVGRKGTAGSVLWIDHSLWPIDTTFVALPKAGISLEFLYHALLAADLPALTADSAVPGLNRDTALARAVVLPSRDELERFTSVAKPLHRLAAVKVAEAERLCTIRDELLPKLVSGKLRVAEDYVPDAAATQVGRRTA